MATLDGASAGPRSLACLLQVDDLGLWNVTELGPILEHQLDAPLDLDLDLRTMAEQAGDRPDSGSERVGAEIRTFRQLLLHPHPPGAWLNRVKQFAKDCRSQPDGPLPHEVATVLYLAAIAAARGKCHQRISTLDDAAWQRAVEWALAQTWLNAGIRELLNQVQEP
jgi:hypothetical protein